MSSVLASTGVQYFHVGCFVFAIAIAVAVAVALELLMLLWLFLFLYHNVGVLVCKQLLYGP